MRSPLVKMMPTLPTMWSSRHSQWSLPVRSQYRRIERRIIVFLPMMILEWSRMACRAEGRGGGDGRECRQCERCAAAASAALPHSSACLLLRPLTARMSMNWREPTLSACTRKARS